jgi:hypothetical protein
MSQSNLGGLSEVAVSAPVIERVEDAEGVLWCVSYAGMRRCHRQEWQAQWLYEAALAAYGAEQERLGSGELFAA